MKKITSASLLLLALTATQVQAEESWLDKIKGMLGMQSTETEAAQSDSQDLKQLSKQLTNLPNANGMIESLTSELGINTQQAEGGMGALLNYAKQNVSSDDFAALAKQVPGLEGLLSSAPKVSDISSSNLGGLLDKAAEYNDTLKSLNLLKKQFESLGLDTDMIMGFVAQAQAYLDTPEGKQAKEMLQQGLSKLQF